MDYSQLYVRRIRSLCRAHGISINRLAGISGVKQSTLDNIVRGLTKNPRVATLLQSLQKKLKMTSLC